MLFINYELLLPCIRSFVYVFNCLITFCVSFSIAAFSFVFFSFVFFSPLLLLFPFPLLVWFLYCILVCFWLLLIIVLLIKETNEISSILCHSLGRYECDIRHRQQLK